MAASEAATTTRSPQSRAKINPSDDLLEKAILSSI
jgi:hypothetical protein